MLAMGSKSLSSTLTHVIQGVGYWLACPVQMFCCLHEVPLACGKQVKHNTAQCPNVGLRANVGLLIPLADELCASVHDVAADVGSDAGGRIVAARSKICKFDHHVLLVCRSVIEDQNVVTVQITVNKLAFVYKSQGTSQLSCKPPPPNAA
jgi:hypothetical protein